MNAEARACVETLERINRMHEDTYRVVFETYKIRLENRERVLRIMESLGFEQSNLPDYRKIEGVMEGEIERDLRQLQEIPRRIEEAEVQIQRIKSEWEVK